jgi:hypothetical protein
LDILYSRLGGFVRVLGSYFQNPAIYSLGSVLPVVTWHQAYAELPIGNVSGVGYLSDRPALWALTTLALTMQSAPAIPNLRVTLVYCDGAAREGEFKDPFALPMSGSPGYRMQILTTDINTRRATVIELIYTHCIYMV